MKNFKYIIVLTVLTMFTFTSCSNDDDVVFTPRNITLVKLAVSGDVIVPASVTEHPVVVELGTTLERNALLTYTVNGTEFNETVQAGTATYEIMVTNTLGQINEVVLNSVAVLYDGDFDIDFDNNTTRIIGGPESDEDVFVSMTFDGGAYDLDLFIKSGASDSNGSTIVSSEGVTGTETVTFPSTAADGIYSVEVIEFDGFFTPATGDTISYQLLVIHPDVSDSGFAIYDKEVVLSGFPLTLEKTTDAGNSSFTFTEL